MAKSSLRTIFAMLVVLLLVSPGTSLDLAAHASGSMICGQVKNGALHWSIFSNSDRIGNG